MTYYVATNRRDRVHSTRTCRGLATANNVESVSRSRAAHKRPCAICFSTEEEWDRVIRETRNYAVGLFEQVRGMQNDV